MATFALFFAKKNSFEQVPSFLFLGQQVAIFRPEEKTPPTLPEKPHYSISLVLKTSTFNCYGGNDLLELHREAS
jgi:hypothetical protein